TAIALSNNNVKENQPGNTVVGYLSSTDQDSGDSHTYSIVGGGSAYITILNNGLQTTQPFDYESQASYSVAIRSDDGNGGTFDQTFTILVTDANDVPTDIVLDNTAIDENRPAGSVVGTFSTLDQDGDNAHSYALVAGDGDNDNGAFTISGRDLRTGASFNFETQSSYTIRVQTTDGGGLTREEVFTITVNDLNEAPEGLALSVNVIGEGKPAGTTVGVLRTTDQDAGDTFTYTLTGGDRSAFTIDGATLKTAASFNAALDASYSVEIEVADSGGLTRTESFTGHVVEAALNVALLDAWAGDQPVVMANYDGEQWFALGGGPASTDPAGDVAYAVDQSRVVWLAYTNGNNQGRATVLRYLYGAWEQVGSAGFTPENAGDLGLAVDAAGTPYLAFRDNA